VAPEWIDRTGFADPDESDMLYSVEDFQPGSRLACQISMTDELDGLVVSMPEYQL
jgi:2Fe-2S ferredoxin